MVNPNNGFKWHQDNQNGPVRFEDALRVTMDDTPTTAPCLPQRSHKNSGVNNDAVSEHRGRRPAGLPRAAGLPPEGHDLIVWDAIHKIDGPKNKDWGVEGQGGRKRCSADIVIAGAPYMGEERALFGHVQHSLSDGDPPWAPVAAALPGGHPSDRRAGARRVQPLHGGLPAHGRQHGRERRGDGQLA